MKDTALLQAQSPMRLAFLVFALTLHLAAAATLSSGARTRTAAGSHSKRTRLIGYYDAKEQRDLPLDRLQSQELTHIVLMNAVSVASNGTVLYRAAERPSELSAQALIRGLASLPRTRLIVSLRGHPDDVALDELAEVEDVRKRFAADVASLLTGWNASGVEIEWLADDLAGGKASSAPFDVMEQYHLALLCRDLSAALHAAGGTAKTLSVAVQPGGQEFADGNFVKGYINWLSLQAYSMRSLGDPHPASFKDMQMFLDEWRARGVPEAQLVLGTPLFAQTGTALGTAGDRHEGPRRSWNEIVKASLLQQEQHAQDRRHLRNGGWAAEGSSALSELKGDRFLDALSGKVWLASGINTTRAKMQYVLKHGYGGMAFRDLHSDSPETAWSLLRAARGGEVDFRKSEAGPRTQRLLGAVVPTPVLFQKGMALSKASSLADEKHDEF